MIPLSFNVRAHSNMCTDAVDFLFFTEIAGRRSIVQPAVFTLQCDDGTGMAVEPSLSLHHRTAQVLLQALWDTGLRPNNGAGSGAEADALKKHIAFAEGVASTLLEKRR